MKINNIDEFEATRAERKAFIAAAWNRLHWMSKCGHVDRLRMQEVITKLIQGELIMINGTVPSIVWNKAVALAQSLGVR